MLHPLDRKDIQARNPSYERLRTSKNEGERATARVMEREYFDEQNSKEFWKMLSMIAGGIGLFIGGIILGPLAIWLAKKAERLGVDAGFQIAMGWVITIVHVLITIVFLTR